MRTVVKSVKELTPEEYQYCYRANLGIDGTLQSDISYLRKFDSSDWLDAKVILAWDDNAQGASRLQGWCLFFYNTHVKKVDTGFYVKKKFRRKGVGTALMKELKNYSKRPLVHPWTDENGKFFSNFKVQSAKTDRDTFMDKRSRIC